MHSKKIWMSVANNQAQRWSFPLLRSGPRTSSRSRAVEALGSPWRCASTGGVRRQAGEETSPCRTEGVL